MYCEVGRVSTDIEMRGSEENKVARFNLAVGRLHKYEGQPDTDFVHCVAFGRLAEIFGEHVKKGQQLYIIGRLENDTYTDRDGKRHDDWVIKVDNFRFIGSKPAEKTFTLPPDMPCPF